MTDLVWGINRGHPTNRRVLAPRKGVSSERVRTIRSVVREVAGFAPYERRAMELIRNSKVCMKKGCGREAAVQWRTVSRAVWSAAALCFCESLLLACFLTAS